MSVRSYAIDLIRSQPAPYCQHGQPSEEGAPVSVPQEPRGGCSHGRSWLHPRCNRRCRWYEQAPCAPLSGAAWHTASGVAQSASWLDIADGEKHVRPSESRLAWRPSSRQERLLASPDARTSPGQPERLHPRAPAADGAEARATASSLGGGRSHKRRYVRQSHRESSAVPVERRALAGDPDRSSMPGARSHTRSQPDLERKRCSSCTRQDRPEASSTRYSRSTPLMNGALASTGPSSVCTQVGPSMSSTLRCSFRTGSQMRLSPAKQPAGPSTRQSLVSLKSCTPAGEI